MEQNHGAVASTDQLGLWPKRSSACRLAALGTLTAFGTARTACSRAGRATMSDDREKLGLSLCPFCGGAARFGKCAPGEQEGENDGAEYVECCDCGASTCLVFPLMDSAKQVLRDMWNRRTAVPGMR